MTQFPTRTHLAGAILLAAGCGSTTDQGLLPNLPTKESQEALVAGLKPVPPRARLLRHLGPPKEADGVFTPLPPGDYSSTPDAQKGYAVEKDIQKNIAGSDWPAEAAPGKERVIFVDTVAREEWELEYTTADLQALATEATSRGINGATEGGVAGSPIPPGVEPLGWSNGVDSRVQKPISTTYPMNQRELMRIGELNGGGCSGALIGRRLVLTAAHCVVPMTGEAYNHTYRARRSGAQVPYGAPTSVGYYYSGNWKPNRASCCALNASSRLATSASLKSSISMGISSS